MKHEDGIEVYLKPCQWKYGGWLGDPGHGFENENDNKDGEKRKGGNESESKNKNEEKEEDDLRSDDQRLLSSDDESENEAVFQDYRANEKRKQASEERRRTREALNCRLKEGDRAREEEQRATEAKREKVKKVLEGCHLPELNIREQDPFRKRCDVPTQWKYYEVIIRFSENFNMFSGNSIRFGVVSTSVRGELRSETIEQSSRIAGQHFRVSEGTGDHLRGSTSLFLQPSDGPVVHATSQRESDDLKTEAGTILVRVTRGTTTWKSESPGDPSLQREVRKASFDRLNDAHGRSYIFEFCPTYKDATTADKKLVTWVVHFIHRASGRKCVRKYRMAEDVEFADVQARTERIRAEMHRVWWVKNAGERCAGENRARINRGLTPIAFSQPIKVASKPRRKTPVTCDCPVEHSPVTTSTKGKAASSKPKITSPAIAGKKHDMDDLSSGTNSATTQLKNLAKETLAKKCGQCSKYKKLPRGKKLAYRKTTRAYMYVHKDAPDGDELLEEEDDEGPPEEEDNEEPSPRGDTVPEQDVVTTVEATDPTTTDEQVQQPHNTDGMLTANEGDDTVPEESDEREANLSTAAKTPVETASETKETSDPQSVSSATQQGVEATNSVPSAGDTEIHDDTAGDQQTGSEGTTIEGVSLINAEGQITPQEQLPGEEADSGSKKRQSESELETPPPKKTRFDIDLTIEEDNATAVVKSEHEDTCRRRTAKRQDEDEDGDLEHELRQIERQERLLNLAMRKADIERKLVKSRAQGGIDKRLDDGIVIKIED